MSYLIRPRSISFCVWLAVSATMLSSACRKTDTTAPVATPALRLDHDRVPAGGPIEITYKFVVAPDARFAQDYQVMAHVVDVDKELMWTDDHHPPKPTTQWKPGQTIEYTRTVFTPIFPYVGDATIQVGLYSTSDQKRLPLAGEDAGQRAYTVAHLQLLPQTENLFTVFKDGWQPAETATNNPSIEWQWTKKEATLAFKNPKKDAVLYLDADSPQPELHPTQQVTVTIGGQAVDQFALMPDQRVLRKVKLPANSLGSGEMSELQIAVDKTFIPAQINPTATKDPRELGVRVFHAYVDAR